ncbi:MAG TPA: cysteine dioxygenase family protein [Syntrophomonadaceae bacterium]|nr:cysteine dioxygenase family protein [Syntrophomonadaceae bacterium]
MSIGYLEQFSVTFQNLLDKNLPWPDFLAQGREMVGKLATEPGWLNNTLARLVLDEAFLQSQYQSMDPNDILLYRSPSHSFSIRAYIWESGVRYPIHDHGSWGIVSAHFNQIREFKYQRLDDGSREGWAQVRVNSEAVLNPGETTYVLPLNEGLHQMETVDDQVAITIHVYGSPVRKGFIQYFDVHHQSVYRVFPPQLQKKALAMRTLGCMPETWSEEVLQEAVNRSVPSYMALEGQLALDNLMRLKDQK